MANYLIDVNLPRYFSLWAGDDYTFVLNMDPTWKDSEIWNHAKMHNFTIVSKDADFSDRVLLEEDTPPVIHIRTGNMKMRDFHGFLSGVWEEVCLLSENQRLVQVYHDRIETIE